MLVSFKHFYKNLQQSIQRCLKFLDFDYFQISKCTDDKPNLKQMNEPIYINKLYELFVFGYIYFGATFQSHINHVPI